MTMHPVTFHGVLASTGVTIKHTISSHTSEAAAQDKSDEIATMLRDHISPEKWLFLAGSNTVIQLHHFAIYWLFPTPTPGRVSTEAMQ